MNLETEAKRGVQLVRAGCAMQSLEETAARIRAFAAQGSPEVAWLRALVAQPINVVLMTWAALWAESGLQQIVMSHKLAASLMSTHVPADIADGVGSPWRAFVLLVPTGLCRVPHLRRPHETCSIDYVFVIDDAEGPVLVARSREADDFAIVSRARAWSELTYVADDTEDELFEGARMPDDVHKRALVMLARLVIGSTIEMTTRENVREPKAPRASPGGRKRGDDAHITTYQLMRDVVVDCRPAVDRYLQHTGARAPRPPNVQTLVRGHWRQHAYGPQRSERKLIHIEPYWRGPEDAPIAVRAHRIRDPET